MLDGRLLDAGTEIESGVGFCPSLSTLALEEGDWKFFFRKTPFCLTVSFDESDEGLPMLSTSLLICCSLDFFFFAGGSVRFAKDRLVPVGPELKEASSNNADRLDEYEMCLQFYKLRKMGDFECQGSKRSNGRKIREMLTGKSGNSILRIFGFFPFALGISSLTMTMGVVSDSGSENTV